MGGGQKVRSLPRNGCSPWASREGAWDVLGVLPGCAGPLGVLKS